MTWGRLWHRAKVVHTCHRIRCRELQLQKIFLKPMLEVFSKFFFPCVPSCSFLQYNDLYLTFLSTTNLCACGPWPLVTPWCSMLLFLFPTCSKFSQLSSYPLNLTIWSRIFCFLSFKEKVIQATDMSSTFGRLGKLWQLLLLVNNSNVWSHSYPSFFIEILCKLGKRK